MLPKQTSFGSLLIAVAILGIAGSGGVEAYKALSQKAQDQATEVDNFHQWKARYTQLLPVEEKWNKALPDVASVKDLYSVYKQVGDKPYTNPDKLTVLKVERLLQDGKDLGGQRVCLGSLTAAGLLFQEKEFKPLLEGLRGLAERPDVQMGTVKFTQDKDSNAIAVVSDFCLIFRDSGPKSPNGN